MKRICLALLFVALAASTAARADMDVATMLTMKQMVQDALSEGSAEGVVTGDIAKMFGAATHSSAPIHISMKRVKVYEHGCGRLHVKMEQAGIKARYGQDGPPEFEFSICPDGRPAHEEVERMEAEKRAAMKSCVAKVEKGAVEHVTGSMGAVITASGCPANGVSHWRYTGPCKALEMPAGIDVAYPIDKDGNIHIKLLVPPQCIPAKNTWHAVVLDGQKTPLGDIQAVW